MALVNVRRDNPDPFYRYKMEKIQTKIEGKGNGIKTVVVNLPSVAQSLARPGAYVIKYFGFELGAQTNIDPKDDRWIINGAHDSAKLQDHLDGFINKFVLCKKCKNPETVVNIKDGYIILDCKACGQLTDVDLKLKLSGFILKNQPKKGKKDKAERKAARKAKQNGTAKDGSGSGGEDGSDNGSEENGANGNDADYESDAELQKLRAEAAAGDVETEDKEDEWAVDMSEEAVKARQAQLPDEFKQKLNIEDGNHSVYDQLGDFVQDLLDSGRGGTVGKENIAIWKKVMELDIEHSPKTMLVLAQTVFNENILEQIPGRAVLFRKVYEDDDDWEEPKATDESPAAEAKREEKKERRAKLQKAFLGGLERLLGTLSEKNPDILQKVEAILKACREPHLLKQDEVTKKWALTSSSKYTDRNTSRKVRRAAKDYVDWLEGAPEVSSTDLGSDESDSDDE